MTSLNPYEFIDVGREGKIAGNRSLVCGWGIYCIAAVHVIAALVVGILIFTQDLDEAVGMPVVVALVGLAVGLWLRHRGTRPFVLIIHGAIALMSFVVLPACATFLLLVPVKGTVFLHIYALFGLCASLILGLLSAWIVWYMHKRVKAGSASLHTTLLSD